MNPSRTVLTMRELGYVDVVDFVERTTYRIWNDHQPHQVARHYPPGSVIWSDSGDVHGGRAVEANTRRQQAELPSYRGLILDTIWTGDDSSGYRTSMRMLARATTSGAVDEASGDQWSSCMANCVILDGQYVEEWGTASNEELLVELATGGDRVAPAAQLSGAPTGPEAQTATRTLGASVPAVPADLDGAGLLVAELVEGLYGRGDLALIEKRYAPGAPYCCGTARWQVGHAGVTAEVRRWLDLLPRRQVSLEELYWNRDTEDRYRVAVRFVISGTALVGGRERQVSLTAIHHVHVRGALVVAEWSEYDHFALRSQLLSTAGHAHE